MKLRLTAAAARDIREAREWYDQQSPGLGDRFEATVDSAFAHLLELPRAFPVVHREIRRAPLGGGFAYYHVFYRDEGDSLVVLAVIHSSRHPRVWQRRW